MATVDLITESSTDGVKPAVSVTGPCTIKATGDSEYDGAFCNIQIADNDVDEEYEQLGLQISKTNQRNGDCNALGTYFLRVDQGNSGPATSITITAAN